MKKVFYVRMIEVKPLPQSEMKKANPDAKGAYVDCIVSAENEAEAVARARSALEKDSYKVRKPKEVIDFSECELEDEETAMAYKALAWDAAVHDMIGYGAFQCW